MGGGSTYVNRMMEEGPEGARILHPKLTVVGWEL